MTHFQKNMFATVRDFEDFSAKCFGRFYEKNIIKKKKLLSHGFGVLSRGFGVFSDL